MTDVGKGTLLFVSSAPGDALRAARRLFQRSAIVSSAPLTWQVQHVDDQLTVNPYDPTALCDTAAEYGKRHQIAGAVTFDERAVIPAAILQEALGLLGNGREAAYASRNKYVMRMRFSEAGLATPKFFSIRSFDEAVRLVRNGLSFPLVLKPLFGMASEGVLRV